MRSSARGWAAKSSRAFSWSIEKIVTPTISPHSTATFERSAGRWTIARSGMGGDRAPSVIFAECLDLVGEALLDDAS